MTFEDLRRAAVGLIHTLGDFNRYCDHCMPGLPGYRRFELWLELVSVVYQTNLENK